MPSQTKPDYFDPKVLGRISRMELRARYIVEGFICGLHRSPYHGQSVEFATHREYVPGDDIKHIDWKVWARNDRFFIKQYEEETNLRCTIILDCSKSMIYGEASEGMSKFDYGATLAASLAHLLQQQQDAVGLVLFDKEIRVNLPPKSHPRHLRVLLHELQEAVPDNTSDVGNIFLQLAEQIGRRGIVILISDLFLDEETLNKSLLQFRHRKHEVVVFHLLHEHEVEFPFKDNTMFRGLEVDQELLAEPAALRKAYLEAVEKFRVRSSRLCAKAGIDFVPLHTGEPLDAALSRYLASRGRAAANTRGR